MSVTNVKLTLPRTLNTQKSLVQSKVFAAVACHSQAGYSRKLDRRIVDVSKPEGMSSGRPIS